MELLIGSVGFLLFFIYDWNRIFWKKKEMQFFFLLGCLCQAAAGVGLLFRVWERKTAGWPVYLLLALLFLAALIYTLFFALPFDSTYCQEADSHRVCRSGIYGWCRHPGIWWFFGCFVSLGLGSGELYGLLCGLMLSFLNLMYAWYQDRLIFPREFSDYGEYRKEVPFLLPMRGQKR